MRYPKGAATLLSTVFTFGVKSGVAADIFDSSNKLLSGLDTAMTNGLTAISRNSPNSAVTSKQNSATADAGILKNPADTSAGGTDVIASSSEITIAATCDEYVICKDGYDSVMSLAIPSASTRAKDSAAHLTTLAFPPMLALASLARYVWMGVAATGAWPVMVQRSHRW